VPLQVAPNPWGRGRPAFTLNLAQAGPVRLAVYDASGRRLRAVFDSGSRPVDAGTHRVCWDGRDERDRQVGAGVYLVRLETTAGIYGTKLVRTR